MLEVCRSDTMGRLKKKIQEEKGYSARHSTFGQADEDDKTLDYYHFDETVTLKLWPKGKRRVRDPKLLDKSRMNPPAAGDTQGGSGGSDGEDATAVGDTQGGSGGSHGEDVSDKFGESSGKAEERGLSIRIKKD